jgi:hypothetical protein
MQEFSVRVNPTSVFCLAGEENREKKNRKKTKKISQKKTSRVANSL